MVAIAYIMKLSNFQLAYILLSIPSHMQVDGDQCVFFVHSDCPISTTSKTPFREVKGEVHIMNIQPRLTSRTLVVQIKYSRPYHIQVWTTNKHLVKF